MKLEELKSELRGLAGEYAKMGKLPKAEKAEFGRKLNIKKQKLLADIAIAEEEYLSREVPPLDITAPCAPGAPLPTLAPATEGSRHPLMTEMDRLCEVYTSMGFDVIESRQIDDEFHMFDSLNFPAGHPARDGYDTFRTEEGFIPPAHTSTMEHRVLKEYKHKLEAGGQIAVVIPGRVFRNEDIDATHEHTLYQCEGMFVSKDANLGQMIGVLTTFFELYFEQKLHVKTQPGYFPFTEPSLEFLIEKPKALGGKGGSWLEMLGCGMTHPNVLRAAGIDPTQYRGFAWGGGIDRLAMLRREITDIRWFESGKLKFLKEFK